ATARNRAAGQLCCVRNRAVGGKDLYCARRVSCFIMQPSSTQALRLMRFQFRLYPAIGSVMLSGSPHQPKSWLRTDSFRMRRLTVTLHVLRQRVLCFL
uniref:Uncharacterized protein n=1 Tax=Aegilops tauschii subsp. strangulata TaxID=200361 RepID=A0A453HBH0_AEGTS